MKRLSTNGSIAQAMKCEMIIPIDPLNINDIENCKTRNWGIPGEILYFYIVTSSTILQLDTLSFTVFLNKKPTNSRISPNSNESQNSDQSFNPIELIDNITEHKSQNSPFRLSDGRAVYPLSIKIPITMNVPFSIDVYLLRNPEPIIIKDLFPILPFDISVRQNSTTVSSIMKFSILAKLKYSMIQEICIDEVNVKFDARPPHNDQDIISNVQIRKASNDLIKCSMKNDDKISAVFSFVPLSEHGAALLTNLPIQFIISWHCENLSYSTIWQTHFVHDTLDLAVFITPTKAKIMETFSMPIKITNLSDRKRKLEIIFDCGQIQPITSRMRIPEIQAKSSVTVSMSAIAKSSGYQPLEFCIEEDEKKVRPLYPIYVYVNE